MNLDSIFEEQVYPTPKPSIKNLRRHATATELPLLQQVNPNEGAPEFNPVNESEENGSYDLIAPYEGGDLPLHKLERLADIMFSSEHMLQEERVKCVEESYGAVEWCGFAPLRGRKTVAPAV